MKLKNQALAYKTVSFAIILPTVILPFIAGSNDNVIGEFPRLVLLLLLTGSMFTGLMLVQRLGISSSSTSRTTYTALEQKNGQKPIIEGHHPVCGGFSGHTVTLLNKKACARCTGLAIGCAISVVIALVVLRFVTSLSFILAYALVILGAFLSLLGVFYPSVIKEQKRDPITDKSGWRLIASVLMPIGFTLLCIGLLFVTGNIYAAFAGWAICLVLVDSRIALSGIQHRMICYRCNQNCPRAYRFRTLRSDSNKLKTT